MYYTYVISSTTRKYLYVGLTNDMNRRLFEHNSGHNKTTSPYKPFVLLLKEHHNTRTDARKHEKYLKSGCGKEWVKKTYL